MYDCIRICVYVCLYICVSSVYGYVFTNLSARAECDTKSILKRNLTGLNSEF